MIKTDEFYVINQPKHASLVIVDMGGANLKTPLSSQFHDYLDQIREGNDLVFMFSKDNNINLDKFSTLYRACMYVVKGDNDARTLIRTLDYIREIFNSHVQVGFMRYNSAITSDCIKRLTDTKTMSLNFPVLEIGRYSSDEFFKIYGKKESGWKKKEDNRGIHRIYYTTSPLIRLGLNTIDILRALDPSYYTTFSGDYLWDLIPSFIKYYEQEYIEESL